MDYFTLCVTFISLLLGIAYPILIQITSEDKYSSEAILDLFETSNKKKFFTINLITSLILVLLVYLKLPPLFKFNVEWIDYLFSNSAKILLLIFSILLIINFFRLINLIQTFYRTTKLIDYLGKQRKKVVEKNDFISFEGMSDILFWSIQNQNMKVARKVSSYFYEIFQEYRENWDKEKDEKNEGLIYPDLFYGIVYNTIEQSVKADKNSYKFLEARTSGLTWLLGEFKCPKISERTYVWMWRNIVLAIENNRLDLVFMHWSSAHQYFSMNLEYLSPEYDNTSNEIIVTNQKLIDERANERELFLEFHFALGGLLLYKNKVKFIKKLFAYTTSQPADYYLLPIHMNQVFHMFFKFFDPNERHFPWITTKYYFPDLDGVGAQGVIKSWVCQYIGILFIRQFNLQTYLSYQAPTENPILPTTTAEKRQWLDNISYFKEIIKVKVNDEELMKNLNFEVNSQYLDKITEIEKEIKNDFDYSERTAVPLGEKVELYYNTVNKLLTPTFNSLEPLVNVKKKPNDSETDVFNINGQTNLTEKGSFTDNGIAHLNFHSFLPETTSRRFKENLSSIFYVNSKEHYYVTQEDAFKAVDNLKINADNYIIVLFGAMNFSYYINNLNVSGLSENNYKGIDIIYFPVSIRVVGTSLFVIKKKHLPWINFNEISEKYVDLYELKLLNDKYKLYSTVSDLNTNNQLREAIIKEGKDKDTDLEKFVFQGINFNTTLRFSKKLKLVRIQIKGYFDNGRKTNSLSDIKKF
jgi:hypothetical protein